MLNLIKEKIKRGKIKDFAIDLKDEEIYGFYFEDGTKLIVNFSFRLRTLNCHFSVNLGYEKIFESINPFKKFFFRSFVREKIKELFKKELKLNGTE